MNIKHRADVICIEGRRDGYTPTQLDRTMTVGELIEFLSGYDEDTPVILDNDNGYTYGAITNYSIEVKVWNDEDERFCEW